MTNACVLHDPNEMIQTNHAVGPHALMVPPADVAAGVDKTYSIQGASTHDHMITITAAMFTMLDAGTMISVTSTTGGTTPHTHVVTVICA